jgi:hypothetical protein
MPRVVAVRPRWVEEVNDVYCAYRIADVGDLDDQNRDH